MSRETLTDGYLTSFGKLAFGIEALEKVHCFIEAVCSFQSSNEEPEGLDSGQLSYFRLCELHGPFHPVPLPQHPQGT